MDFSHELHWSIVQFLALKSQKLNFICISRAQHNNKDQKTKGKFYYFQIRNNFLRGADPLDLPDSTLFLKHAIDENKL